MDSGSSQPATPQGRPIWVVTDGRAGNENPALGLAERVSARLEAPVETWRLELAAWAAALPAPLWPAFGASVGGWPFRGLTKGQTLGRLAQDPVRRPSVVIGAGRRAASIVAALGKLSAGTIRTVQLLDPKIAPRHFDLIITPRHDGRAGDGRLATVGSLHRVDPNAPPPADPRLPNGAPRVALLIGGKSKSASFGALETQAVLRAIADLASANVALAATASRRTPADAAAEIAAALRGAGGFFWDGTGDNPYLALLHWADQIIVTADSVNMASEACALGKPVYIAPAERRARKFERFHEALFRGDHARALPAPLDTTSAWTPTPLDDMTAATNAVIDLLGPSAVERPGAPHAVGSPASAGKR